MKTKAFQPNLEGKGPRDKHLFGGLAAQSVASASSLGAPSHGFLDTLDFHPPHGGLGLLVIRHARNLVVVHHALGVTLSREWLTPSCGS